MQIRLSREHIVGDTPRPSGTVIDVDTVTGQWLIERGIGVNDTPVPQRVPVSTTHHPAPAKPLAEPKHEPLEDAK